MKLVLAGDHNQLLPVVKAPIAKTLGLQYSLMETFIKTKKYSWGEVETADQKTNFDLSKCQNAVQLVNNYRSHPAIFKIPNELFYKGSLNACAPPIIAERLLAWERLPAACRSGKMCRNGVRGFPLLFHCSTGVESRPSESPSWRNQSEANIVESYVSDLLQTGIVDCNDIGIISPYRGQVKEIRQKLSKLKKIKENISSISIGPVEVFQGDERPVIILSTVRSSEDHLQFDLKFSLGFVNEPRRFNTAVTRAQSLLIIVGNPLILCRSPFWLKLILHAHENGGCVGEPLKIATGKNEGDFFISVGGKSVEVNENYSTANGSGPSPQSESVQDVQDKDFEDEFILIDLEESAFKREE